MVNLYTDDDLWEATMQRRKLLAIFLSVLAVWTLAFAGMIVWYALLPYKDPMQKWVIAITCVITALFLIFAFPFMGICYKRCNAYVKVMQYLSAGLKEYSVAPFEGIDDWTTRDGIDVNVADFFVPNVKRDGMMTRQIYIDGEKFFPPFEENKRVKLITQGNILISYEIIEEAAKEEKETEKEAVEEPVTKDASEDTAPEKGESEE